MNSIRLHALCFRISLIAIATMWLAGIASAQSNDTTQGGGDKGKDKLFDLTFDDLKFDMQPEDEFSREMLTDQIKEYHGSTVRLRGYIRPNFKQTGLTKFVFVRDNQECCFGPQAAIFDNVLVRLDKGVKTDFTVRPITIEGKFALKEYKGPDGKVWSLYRMYQAEVK